MAVKQDVHALDAGDELRSRVTPLFVVVGRQCNFGLHLDGGSGVLNSCVASAVKKRSLSIDSDKRASNLFNASMVPRAVRTRADRSPNHRACRWTARTIHFAAERQNERLCLITEVLGKFVSCAPGAINLAQLEQETGRTARELHKLCAILCREQLLHPHPEQPQCWQLACEASRVTLEDAFRCAVAEKSTRSRPRAEEE